MPQEEFFGWMRFYELEPFGRLVEDSYHEANMQLHWSINSNKGSEIPRFFERDVQPQIVDEIDRVSREEQQFENWCKRYEMTRKAKIKRKQIADMNAQNASRKQLPVQLQPAKVRKPRKDKGMKRSPTK